MPFFKWVPTKHEFGIIDLYCCYSFYRLRKVYKVILVVVPFLIFSLMILLLRVLLDLWSYLFICSMVVSLFSLIKLKFVWFPLWALFRWNKKNNYHVMTMNQLLNAHIIPIAVMLKIMHNGIGLIKIVKKLSSE